MSPCVQHGDSHTFYSKIICVSPHASSCSVLLVLGSIVPQGHLLQSPARGGWHEALQRKVNEQCLAWPCDRWSNWGSQRWMYLSKVLCRSWWRHDGCLDLFPFHLFYHIDLQRWSGLVETAILCFWGGFAVYMKHSSAHNPDGWWWCLWQVFCQMGQGNHLCIKTSLY